MTLEAAEYVCSFNGYTYKSYTAVELRSKGLYGNGLIFSMDSDCIKITTEKLRRILSLTGYIAV